MTDNAKVFRSLPFIASCRRRRMQHIFTKIYTPRTDGKAERFIQTALRGLAYGNAYRNARDRSAYLPDWFHRYNPHRPHSALTERAPINKLSIDGDNLLRLHSGDIRKGYRQWRTDGDVLSPSLVISFGCNGKRILKPDEFPRILSRTRRFERAKSSAE